MARVRRWDIWTIQAQRHPKPRPAIVLSIDPVNDLCPDIIVVPVTTKEGPLRVPLPDKPDATGLREASHAKCEGLGPVHQSCFKRQIGRVPREARSSIEDGVRRVLGLA